MPPLDDGIDVLHIDDDPEFGAVTAEYLEREDPRLNVSTITAPREGLDWVAENSVDCVVCDFDMPDLDGLDVLEAIRRRDPNLPFILYTGKGSEAVASEAISAGVTDYLRKDGGTSQYAILANRIVNSVEKRYAEQTYREEVVKEGNEGTDRDGPEIIDQKVYERQIAAMHEATREMVQETDMDAICEIMVRTVAHILEFELSGVWLFDADENQLEPVATTEKSADRFGSHPIYTDGDSLSWRAFHRGETLVFDDLKEESGTYNPDTRIRSEIIVPIGPFGVLNIGSPETHAFRDNDVALAKLLAANTAVALERAERERELAQQTSQMEFFNSILRHDVLNGMTVIKTRAEVLADELEGDHRRHALTISDWCETTTKVTKRVRKVVETLAAPEQAHGLEPIDVSSILRQKCRELQQAYPEVTFRTSVPDDIHASADEMLSDVIGNILTNSIEHNDTTGLRIEVTAKSTPDTIRLEIADNGVGIDDARKESIFRRGETSHSKETGSGFGLFFVDVMIKKYDGEIWVEDSENGGACFVIELCRDGEHG